MITIKEINIENRPCYFFNDLINIKNFDPNLLSIDKISFKSTGVVIYKIKYITMKSFDHVNIDSEDLLYLIFSNVNAYIEESNEDKNLIFASTNKSKKVFKKYTELCDEIKNQIETINVGKPPNKYKKDFMKIKFESNDNLPLVKILSIPSMIIVVKSVLQKDKNYYYPQVYLHECGYKFVSING